MQNKDYRYIDKTKSLEEGIARFPYVYIQGSKNSNIEELLQNYKIKSYIRGEIRSCLTEEKRYFS